MYNPDRRNVTIQRHGEPNVWDFLTDFPLRFHLAQDGIREGGRRAFSLCASDMYDVELVQITFLGSANRQYMQPNTRTKLTL